MEENEKKENTFKSVVSNVPTTYSSFDNSSKKEKKKKSNNSGTGFGKTVLFPSFTVSTILNGI